MRLSAARAFLDPVRERQNLCIRKRVAVRRILFRDNTAVGVEVTGSGCGVEKIAAGQVILSAGAIGSPQLLQVSGVRVFVCRCVRMFVCVCVGDCVH